MSKRASLVIEIGAEEIPAGVAPRMGEAFRVAVAKLLADENVQADEIWLGVTPRRLLLHSLSCPVMQEEQEEIIWGPPERVAFKEGSPTKAAEGFAKKAGVSLDAFELADKGDGRGRYLKTVRTVQGRKVADVLAEAMPGILRALPSPKQMKWNDGKARDDAFIRPVRWIVARLGEEVIPFSFAGVEAGKESCGHRVHGGTGELDINDPSGWLQKQCVVAGRDNRIAIIREQLEAAAKAAGVDAVADDLLVEEVADLTEWPQVIVGRYDREFLNLPEEVSRIELKNHQRCFAARNRDGSVSNAFFAVANISSKDSAAVAHGNERVVNARLADAAFYFERDPGESLESRVEKLSKVTYQEGLGMVGDQVRRLRSFVLDNARAAGAQPDSAQRAAYLCKSDLTTGLVGEFPELQGYMGGVYAGKDGELPAVAQAISEHYQPVGAEDALPKTADARIISIAERADKLLGYFHIGRIPTASADPFGLRRAAIGLIRLLADGQFQVDMTLSHVITDASKQWNQQRVTIAIGEETRSQVHAFILERLTGMADSFGVSRRSLDAALHSTVEIPLYRIIKVADLLTRFASSDQGQAVVSANKRIANLLKKAARVDTKVNQELFQEEAEKNLFRALEKTENSGLPVPPDAQLDELAKLRIPVDQFFDNVMVMVDDEKLRNNRLALLMRLRVLFLELADISRL